MVGWGKPKDGDVRRPTVSVPTRPFQERQSVTIIKEASSLDCTAVCAADWPLSTGHCRRRQRQRAQNGQVKTMVGWQRGTTGTAQRKQAAVRGVPSISRRFIHFQQGLKPGLTGIRTTRLFLLLCIDPLLNRLAVSLSVAQWS